MVGSHVRHSLPIGPRCNPTDSSSLTHLQPVRCLAFGQMGSTSTHGSRNWRLLRLSYSRDGDGSPVWRGRNQQSWPRSRCLCFVRIYHNVQPWCRRWRIRLLFRNLPKPYASQRARSGCRYERSGGLALPPSEPNGTSDYWLEILLGLSSRDSAPSVPKNIANRYVLVHLGLHHHHRARYDLGTRSLPGNKGCPTRGDLCHIRR